MSNCKKGGGAGTKNKRTVSLYDENGNKRNPMDVLKEVQEELEDPGAELEPIDLTEPEESPQTEAPEEIKEKFLYSMGTADKPENIEICPMNGNKITIHGAEEAWFLICRLLDCFQTV